MRDANIEWFRCDLFGCCIGQTEEFLSLWVVVRGVGLVVAFVVVFIYRHVGHFFLFDE